jgi:HAD superfamily hydrolase (TIGR01549 family)
LVGIAEVAGVIFDWDDVLLDSLGASLNVYNKIFERIGARRLTMDEYLAVQSPNWYQFYLRLGVPESLWKEVDEEWVRLYQQESPALQPDAPGCLAALKEAGFKLALVSNGSKPRIERELARFRLRPFFESVLFGERKEELKPSPFMLEKTFHVFGMEARRSVYVGDSPADIQAAKRAEVPSVAIARGPIQAGRLRVEGPDLLLDGLGALVTFLLGSNRSYAPRP